MSRRVHITNEGGVGRNTVVTDEDGVEIPRARSVEIHMGVQGAVTAEITTLIPRVKVDAEAVVLGACPYCGHTKDVDA